MTQDLNEVRDEFFRNLTEKHGERITMYTIAGINLMALNSYVPEEQFESVKDCTQVITSSIIQLAGITEDEHRLSVEQAAVYFKLFEPHESEAS
jgi:hypothetical protein